MKGKDRRLRKEEHKKQGKTGSKEGRKSNLFEKFACCLIFAIIDILCSLFLQSGGMKNVLTDLEVICLMVACLSHDLDHRGTNNNFQVM